jgi:hypothetical protein
VYSTFSFYLNVLNFDKLLKTSRFYLLEQIWERKKATFRGELLMTIVTRLRHAAEQILCNNPVLTVRFCQSLVSANHGKDGYVDHRK